MSNSRNRRAGFGDLERWTIALFALSILFSGIALIGGLVCLAISKFWTVREKLIAVVIPAAAVGIVAIFLAGSNPPQNWIRIPIMLTFSGFGPALAALYLYIRSREGSKVAVY